MRDITYVSELPDCDLHKGEKATVVPAAVNGRMWSGQWAYMCEGCFTTEGRGLGEGLGQRLVVGTEPVKPRPTYAEVTQMSYDELEDMVGDGDIADFF